jgi:hypothetical protein
MQRLVVAVLVAVPAIAAAQEAPAEPAFSPHLSVTATLGVATPLGELGIELDGHLAKWLSLSAGVGASTSGPQLAAMARAHLPIGEQWAMSFGAGASEGKYEWTELVFDEPAKKTWDRAYWLNAELGFERTIYDVNTFRAFFGIGQVLNDDEYMCGGEDIAHCMNDHQGDGARQKYVGLAFSRAFSSL